LAEKRKERTTVKKSYQIATERDSRRLAEFLARNGQILLPMVELIEESKMAVDELLGVRHWERC
jgi:hypothetical protein